MKLTTNVFILTALMSLASCGGSKSDVVAEVLREEIKKDESQIEIQKPANTIEKNGVTFSQKRAVELKEDFSNLAEVKTKLNSFIVTAEFEKPVESTSYFKCAKAVGGDDMGTSVLVSEGTISKEIEIALSEKDLMVDVVCQIITRKKEASSARFTFKKSLLIEKYEKLKSYTISYDSAGYQLDRLIIDKDGGLFIESALVTLNTNDFYSNDGLLGTYSKAEVSPQSFENIIGRDGGHFFIETQRAFGIITAQMAGTHGSDQSQTPADKAFEGVMDDPNRDSITVTSLAECPFQRTVKPVINNLLTPRGPTSDPCRNWRRPAPVCVKAAVAGTAGVRGADGFQGNPGGKSGKIKFVTHEAGGSFQMKFEVIPGLGGKGGAAGKGSLGSNGGKATAACGGAPNGIPGAAGDAGKVGDNGLPEISCVLIRSSKLEMCSNK